jgi:hypothetical protein
MLARMALGSMGMGMGSGMRPRVAATPTPPPWQPSDLGADLLAFWDAEVSANVSLAGSLVTSWVDRVGGYSADQGTSGFRPTYSATSFNGRPGVTFDGTDDYLRTASLPASLPVGTAGSEIWSLASQDFAGTQAGNQSVLAYGDTGNVNCRRLYRINQTNVSRAAGSVTAGAAVDTIVDFSGIHVARATFAATTISVAADGNAATTAALAPATASPGAVSLGALTTGANRFWKGPMNAVIVTNPLSAPDAALLLAWMKARGGLP